MEHQDYAEMLHSIIIPEGLSEQEKEKRLLPYLQFIQNNTPRLYRFRKCNEYSFDALYFDKLLLSKASTVNDDFDGALYFDRQAISSRCMQYFSNENTRRGLSFISTDSCIPFIENLLPPEARLFVQKRISQMSDADIESLSSRIQSFIAQHTEKDLPRIAEVVQTTIKFACFSEAIESPSMWGYYAASSTGFALEYDFTRNQGTDSANQYPVIWSLYKEIYSNHRFDVTEYASWIFCYSVLLELMIQSGLDAQLARTICWKACPCPDLFMQTKILLHKGNSWRHEKEWRLISSSSDPRFYAEDHSYIYRAPKAVYLGRRISKINQEIILEIATKKNLPVYKMQFDESTPEYLLKPLPIDS